MPSTQGKHGWDAGGVPFYGTGRWCWVLDYPFFDMKYFRNGSREGEHLWIGGTLHELGHGLNLPHFKHKANDQWVSLMSWGNHAFNDPNEEVRLTKSAAILLNNNQVLNKQSEIKFYESTPNFDIHLLQIEANEDMLSLKASFKTDIPLHGYAILHDPKQPWMMQTTTLFLGDQKTYIMAIALQLKCP